MLVLQTLIGAWPMRPEELPGLRDRLVQYMIKAAKEAKVNTSWIQEDQRWEDALRAYVEGLFARRAGLLPGQRALGPVAGRSGQPPAGGFRAAAQAPRRVAFLLACARGACAPALRQLGGRAHQAVPDPCGAAGAEGAAGGVRRRRLRRVGSGRPARREPGRLRARGARWP